MFPSAYFNRSYWPAAYWPFGVAKRPAPSAGADEEWEKTRSEAARKRYAHQQQPEQPTVLRPAERVEPRTKHLERADGGRSRDEAKPAPVAPFADWRQADLESAIRKAQADAEAFVAKAAERALEKLHEKQLQEARAREERRIKERLRAEARMKEAVARKKDEDRAIAAVIAALLDE